MSKPLPSNSIPSIPTEPNNLAPMNSYTMKFNRNPLTHNKGKVGSYVSEVVALKS